MKVSSKLLSELPNRTLVTDHTTSKHSPGNFSLFPRFLKLASESLQAAGAFLFIYFTYQSTDCFFFHDSVKMFNLNV